jgi:hypothetical protein
MSRAAQAVAVLPTAPLLHRFGQRPHQSGECSARTPLLRCLAVRDDALCFIRPRERCQSAGFAVLVHLAVRGVDEVRGKSPSLARISSVARMSGSGELISPTVGCLRPTMRAARRICRRISVCTTTPAPSARGSDRRARPCVSRTRAAAVARCRWRGSSGRKRRRPVRGCSDGWRARRCSRLFLSLPAHRLDLVALERGSVPRAHFRRPRGCREDVQRFAEDEAIAGLGLFQDRGEVFVGDFVGTLGSLLRPQVGGDRFVNAELTMAGGGVFTLEPVEHADDGLVSGAVADRGLQQAHVRHHVILALHRHVDERARGPRPSRVRAVHRKASGA